MSDYLWDKSGEPEAEVERLEELLGRLRHTGRAPELPFAGPQAASFELERRAPSRAGMFRPAFFLRPAPLAAAAALLLAVLAGAFVMLRTVNTDGGQASVNKEQVTKPQPPAPEETKPREELSAPTVASYPPKESATPEKLQREPLRRNELVVSKPPFKPQRREPAPRETVARQTTTREFKPATAQSGVLEGGAPDVESRVRAKEQLVYALRLTSEALKEVRGRASGVEVRPNAFDGRNPLR